MSHTQDDPEGQSRPLAIPQGVPYPSVIGAGADPNPAGAIDGRSQQGIDSNGTLPHSTSSDMPEERAIPSREVQNQALMADHEGLGDTSLHFEKQTPPHARDGSHSVNMSISEKPTRRVSNSATSSSDADSTDEKKKKKDGKKKGKKAKAEKATGPKPVSIFQLYRFHTRTEKLLNVLALVLAAAAGATQPLMTLIFGKLTTSFTKFATYQGILSTQGNNPDPTVLAAFNAARQDLKSSAGDNASYLVYIGIGMLVCTYTYMLVWQWTGEVNAKRVRERYLQAVLRQDIAYFDELGAGEVATRIETDTHLVHSGIAEKVPTAVQYISTFITGFVLAFTQEWRLALAMSSILIPITLAGATMQKFMIKHQTASLGAIAKAGTIAEEVISSIRTAQAFGAQKPLAYLFDTHIAKAVKVGSNGANVHALGLAAMFFVIYSGYALAFFFGGRLINRNGIDSGKIITVFLSILIGSFSMAMLAPEMEAIGKARGGAAKLYETIDRVPSIDTGSEEGARLEAVEGRITFENVKFHYPARPDVPILKGLSIEFPPGKTCALVGASGSGKSTVIALTERFYDPTEGIVRLDGHDLKTLNVKWLRQQIGLVSQEPTLFGVSIRQNIEHGLIGSRFENVSDAEKFELVKQAAVQANAHDFIIMNLPAGYDTDVGERGFLISGGQKQRVAIARSIVSDPKILLLDEATSALDTQSEGIVQEALERASIGRTTIVIAHRLSTIKNADNIVVVGAGEIIEQGTHNQLLSNPDSAYAQLVKAQELAAQKEKVISLDDDDSLEGQEATNGRTIMGGDSTSGSENLQREETRLSGRNGELPAGLERKNTQQSIASQVLASRAAEEGQQYEKEKLYSFLYLGKRCYKINREYKFYYLGGLIAAIGSGMVYPAIAILFGYSIRDFSGTDLGAVESRSARNALWYFITAIVAAILIFFQQYFLIHTAETLTGKLRSMMFRGILRQDIAFFDEDKNSTGALTSKLADQPQKVQGLAGVTLGTIVQSISTIVTGMIIGLIYGPKLAAIGIACIPLLVSAGYIRLRVVVLKDEKNKKAHSKSSHMASEAAGSIRTVASLTREEDCLRIYQKALEIPLHNSNRSAIRSNLLYAVTQALSFFVIALVFYVGATWIADGVYPINAFFTVLNSVVFASIQAGNVFNFVPDASKAKSSATSILKQIDMRPEIDAESIEGKMVDGATLQGNIAFDKVHFRYPTRPSVRVLRDLNLNIPAGSFVAFCGASGCGKSTTIGLLERFYDVLAGQVTLDGVPINELNVASFRSHIALVGQEPTLYGGTIRFNILLGANKPADQVTEEELLQACRDANILQFIESLPDGFETECGNKSASRFSGGQKQRIAIARALIRHPKILLLDEATSALDSTSERVVQAALDQAIRGDARRTTVAIAHRLSSIQNADIIFFFKNGSISEAGTHQQLLERRGGYYELTQMQKLSKM